jgi:hypothetical protein
MTDTVRDTVISPLYASIELADVAADAPEAASASAEDAAPRPVHPEERHYSFVKPMLPWIYPLIRLAQAGHITEEDIWAAPGDADVKTNASLLKAAYAQVRRQGVSLWPRWAGGELVSRGTAAGWRGRAESSVVKSIPPFGWAVLVAFRGEIFISGMFHACFAVLQLTLPYLIGELLGYIATGSGGVGHGVGLVCALGLTSGMSSYGVVTAFYHTRRGSLRVRAATMMCVYEQALRLSTASRWGSGLSVLSVL